MKKILAFVLACASPAYASPQAANSLLDALQYGGAAFDGSKPGPAPLAVPAAPSRRAAAFAQAAPPPADVQPTSARGITGGGSLGLYSEDDFVLGTGRCSTCRAPEEGKWYFEDELIATPKSGPAGLVWIGSRDMVDGARISKDGKTVTLQDGTVLPFEIVPKIASNRSYYDASSLAFLSARTVRMRGEFVERAGVRAFVARTVWPDDFRVDPAAIREADAATDKDIDAMVAADKGGAKAPFQAKLLWSREGSGRDWAGKPVIGFMLNGAQGDDDQAYAGHMSLFTGKFAADGTMSDWMSDNFYDMDTVNEKGITAAMTPFDKYMGDLNSGQSWYRPSYLLVMVMKDQRVPLQVQEQFKAQYAKYYAHQITYDHDSNNCTALTVDPIRADGWKFPEYGKTPGWIATLITKLAGIAADANSTKELRQILVQEPTRSFPREGFVSLGGDVLSMERAWQANPLGRELSPFEKQVAEDAVALIWVRLPQIPSSRAFGRDATTGVLDYFQRTGGKSKNSAPTYHRGYPPPH